MAYFDRFKEPDMEEQPIAYDWQGEGVYHGEEIYFIDGEIIVKERLAEYLDSNYGGVKIV